MRAFQLVFVLFVGVAGLSTQADAQNYPWCAYDRNGGFATFAQCMATVSGIHGYCAHNTQYVPFVAMPTSRTRGKRHSHDRAPQRR